MKVTHVIMAFHRKKNIRCIKVDDLLIIVTLTFSARKEHRFICLFFVET